jgi:hypothetical protein
MFASPLVALSLLFEYRKSANRSAASGLNTIWRVFRIRRVEDPWIKQEFRCALVPFTD